MGKELKERSWITFRVKPEEHRQISGRFRKSNCRKLSDYARKVLMEKPVVIYHRNASAEEFLMSARLMVKQLNGIGNNFNQAVHKLHMLDTDRQFKDWYLAWNIGRETMQNRIDEVKKLLQKIYEDGCQDKHAEQGREGAEL
ncbi:MAG: mobilization protein [Mucilaginibacter sp.]|nr:mobilization protein [Mucilaginibacter sp.]